MDLQIARIMVVPTFVDLQGFIVDGRFVAKEVAILRQGTILSHYIFESPMPPFLLSISDKSSLRWLTTKHHGLRWDEEDNASHIVYVKGLQKRDWLADFLDENTKADVVIETLDIDYKDIESLNMLNVVNTLRCGRHAKHCAMQNVFKIFNWWSKHQREMLK